MAGRVVLLLLLASAALAIDVEWSAHDRALVIRNYGSNATFVSASNAAACKRAARVSGGAIRMRLNDFVSSCSAERTAVLGDSFVSLYATSDNSLLVCTGRRSAAEVRAPRLSRSGLEFSLLGGASVAGGKRLRSVSPQRSEWLVESWQRGVKFEPSGSMQCKLVAGEEPKKKSATTTKPLSMKKKSEVVAAAPKKQAAVAKLRPDVRGCVRLPTPGSGFVVQLSRAELCLANAKEAECETVRTTVDGAQVCVADLRRLASEMHSRLGRITAASADTRVQLQYSYTLKRGAELLRNQRAVARVGTANAKRFSPLSECSADDCDVDGDGSSDFVVVTPVSNWVLFAVIIVVAALIIILIFYLVADHFKLRDERRSARRSNL